MKALYNNLINLLSMFEVYEKSREFHLPENKEVQTEMLLVIVKYNY